ncbi:Tetraspanin family [Nesidiocoris tenuis]|uniref:Tetraspanin family n=1 Tax=Nesidiocoris tenuis TaxID=355587 RepID=A0ABN7BD42_9HEMI|nr:Tetraspanin family [Nesidiocoris tenuis]
MHWEIVAFYVLSAIAAAARFLQFTLTFDPEIYLICLGLLLLVIIGISVDAFGVYSVYKSRRDLQRIYSIILLVLWTIDMASSITTGHFSSKSGKQWLASRKTEGLTNLMKNYGQNKAKVDEIQKKYKCCGTASYLYFDQGYPPSCCEYPPCTRPYPKYCDTALVENVVNFCWKSRMFFILLTILNIVRAVLIYRIGKLTDDQ